MFTKVKEFAATHKAAVVGAGSTALAALSACPVFADTTTSTGYLDSTVFSGISTNVLADINTNILPYAWPIFGVILAVGVGIRVFRKVV